MKLTKIIMSFVALLAISVPVSAQTLPTVNGIVTKIDESAEKMTIKHEPIPNLDMGDMTMVFRVADKSAFKKIQKGSKVQFTADRVNGQITIVSISVSK